MPDPNSTNEMHRVHRKGDKRCRKSSFECPSCDETFASPENLQEHIEKEHVQTNALSLLTNASSTLNAANVFLAWRTSEQTKSYYIFNFQTCLNYFIMVILR